MARRSRRRCSDRAALAGMLRASVAALLRPAVHRGGRSTRRRRWAPRESLDHRCRDRRRDGRHGGDARQATAAAPAPQVRLLRKSFDR